jgi:hypothetical protein
LFSANHLSFVSRTSPAAVGAVDISRPPSNKSTISQGIWCPLMLYATRLPLLNSVQKFTCDILGNVATIFINQVLESIHPVEKNRFDHFD